MTKESNLLENIENVKGSVVDGDKYGVLIYEKDSTLALYENVYEIVDYEVEENDLIIYYIQDEKVKKLSCDDGMYRTFMLLPMLGELDGEPVYTGQKVFYKSVSLSLTYQDGTYVYFLDGETNDLFAMESSKFDELFNSGHLRVTKEFVQNKEVVEKEKSNQVTKLTNVLTKVADGLDTVVEEDNQEVTENIYDGVTFAKSSEGEYLYVCLNLLTGEYDIMTPAFVGVAVTGLEYKRYSVTHLELVNMFEAGDIKECEPEEIRDFVFKHVYGGDE